MSDVFDRFELVEPPEDDVPEMPTPPEDADPYRDDLRSRREARARREGRDAPAVQVPAGDGTGEQSRSPWDLELMTLPQLYARRQLRGKRRWLVEGVWIERTPLAVGAEAKLGKSVAMLDLAVAIATGGRWMGTFQVSCPGTVVMFCIEDDEDEVLRRLDAVAETLGVHPMALPVVVSFRAPSLSSLESMARLEAVLATLKPVAAILDPLYLSIGEEGDGSNLFAMGTLLNRFKEACAPWGTAPAIVHHFNKTGKGTGVERFSGTGVTQWARTLIAGSTEDRRVDQVPAKVLDGDGVEREVVQERVTSVLRWEMSGNSIVPQTVFVTRRMWSDIPNDLNCPLRYEVEPREATESAEAQSSARALSAEARVLAVLTRSQSFMDKHDIQEADAQALPLKADGSRARPMQTDTVAKKAAELLAAGRIQGRQVDARGTWQWATLDVDPAADAVPAWSRDPFDA